MACCSRLFFIPGYGMFTLVHLIFLIGLFAPGFGFFVADKGEAGLAWSTLFVSAIGLVISHGSSFINNFIGQDEYKRISNRELTSTSASEPQSFGKNPGHVTLETRQGPGSSCGPDGLDDQLQRVFQGLRIFRRVAFDFKNEPVAAQPPLARDQAG